MFYTNLEGRPELKELDFVAEFDGEIVANIV
jgi:hypothetical protein